MAFSLLAPLQACVSTPTDALKLGPEPLPASQSDVRKSGDFPNINNVPTGQTSQMSPAEKADIKRTFAPITANDGVASAKKAEADYKRELSDMDKLLAEQKRKRESQKDY